MMNFQFDNIKDAIEDIKNGKVVIVVDDENRENEGDLVFCASDVTPKKINLMLGPQASCLHIHI